MNPPMNLAMNNKILTDCFHHSMFLTSLNTGSACSSSLKMNLRSRLSSNLDFLKKQAAPSDTCPPLRQSDPSKPCSAMTGRRSESKTFRSTSCRQTTSALYPLISLTRSCNEFQGVGFKSLAKLHHSENLIL